MHTIKILGVRDHGGTNKLYTNVQRALLGLGVRLEPALIDDVDQLLEYKVGGIPALVVRGQVVSQRYIPNPDALQLFFKTIFLPEENPIKMKNILVPTDFSTTSKNAFEFAKGLAERSNASIKLIHVHYPEVSTLEAAPVDMFAESLKWKQQKLKEFSKTDPARMPEDEVAVLSRVKTEVAIGFPGENIVDRSKTDEVDLIVMGTTGESGMLEKVFGSISSHVARKAHCPVLLVPNDVPFKECQNVLFATDKKAADEVLIENIPYLLTCPNANVHFAHVDEQEGKDYKVEDLSFFNPNLTGQFHFVNIESDNVFGGLNRYAEEQRVDAMVMVTARRPFFEELFHKSMTKQMALNTKMPLLVMHYGD
ncbi:MAG: universal stress protein [Bacteroidota bacterium]